MRWLGGAIQIEYQYLKSTVVMIGTMMGPIEDSLREAFFPSLFGWGEVRSDLI